MCTKKQQVIRLVHFILVTNYRVLTKCMDQFQNLKDL